MPRQARPDEAWVLNLDSLRDHVWARLVRGVHDRHAASHRPTLATLGLDGTLQARTVILRNLNKDAAYLDIFIDKHAGKIHQLQRHPNAAFHIWDRVANLQIRLQASATLLDDSSVRAIWQTLPSHSQRSYGAIPPTASPIAADLDYVQIGDVEAFAVLRFHIDQIEVLHLGMSHRRARFTKVDQWIGQWLVP